MKQQQEEMTIFTASGCIWCTKLIQLVVNLNYKLNVISVKGNEEAIKQLSKLGLNSVPQVFINNNHVGGYEDTKRYLKMKGEVN